MSFSNAICLSGSQGQREAPGILNEFFIPTPSIKRPSQYQGSSRDLSTGLGYVDIDIKIGSCLHLGSEEGQEGS